MPHYKIVIRDWNEPRACASTTEEDASEIIRATMNLARSGRYHTAKSLKRAVQKMLPQCSEAQICMAMSEIGKRGDSK